MDNDKVDLNWDEEKKGGVTEMLRKVVAMGLSSPFLSEEQLKAYLASVNLPKEVVIHVLKGAQKSKDDLVQRVSGEFSKLIQKIDIVKEFKAVLRENKITVRADIEFVPKEKAEPEKDKTKEKEE